MKKQAPRFRKGQEIWWSHAPVYYTGTRINGYLVGQRATDSDNVFIDPDKAAEYVARKAREEAAGALEEAERFRKGQEIAWVHAPVYYTGTRINGYLVGQRATDSDNVFIDPDKAAEYVAREADVASGQSRNATPEQRRQGMR